MASILSRPQCVKPSSTKASIFCLYHQYHYCGCLGVFITKPSVAILMTMLDEGIIGCHEKYFSTTHANLASNNNLKCIICTFPKIISTYMVIFFSRLMIYHYTVSNGIINHCLARVAGTSVSSEQQVLVSLVIWDVLLTTSAVWLPWRLFMYAQDQVWASLRQWIDEMRHSIIFATHNYVI